MKKYRQLVQELPSKKVVMAFGRFQPPTNGHELLVNAVKKIAASQKADHIIFASRTQDKKANPLPVDRKVHYLEKMFPKTNFVAANDQIRTFIEAAKVLSAKYKHLVMLAGSDRVPEFRKLLEHYNGTVFNFETIEVVSAGERDPDADTAAGMSGTKMREAAKAGDYALFKKGLTRTLTDIDGKLLMNEIRKGLGLEAIKEQIEFPTTQIREKYRAGAIFNVGDTVTDGVDMYEIVNRGTNYVTVVNEHGDTSKKWLDAIRETVKEDITPGAPPKEVSFKGYTTKNFHHSADAAKSFQTTIQRYTAGQIKDPVAILNALKATDAYMKINDSHLEASAAPDENELAIWHDAHDKARDSLNRIGEFMHHFDYWHAHEHEIQDMENNFTYEKEGSEFADSVELNGQLVEMKYTQSDKVKIARVIATALGLEDTEKMASADIMIDLALRKIRNKSMRPEYIEVVQKMLQTADEAGIHYDKKLAPQKTVVESELDELSNELLTRYKKKSSDASSKADAEGNFDLGHKRYRGVVKATQKQLKNDTKKYSKEEREIVNSVLEQIANSKLLGKDYSDLKKKLSLSRGNVDTKNGESDMDATHGQIRQEPNQIGHAMVAPDETHHARRMKVQYRTESAETEVDNLKESESTTEDDFEEYGDNTDRLSKTAMGEELDDFEEDDLDDIVNSLEDEEDILSAYDDDELAIIDDETGEHVDDLKEEVLNEVLSRVERIRAKMRFARTQSVRSRRLKVALKTRSSNQVINKRARHLAVQKMKERLARKPLNQLSVGEKERIEKAIERRKSAIDRLAMKMAPRIRKIENDRLSHKVYTK